MSYAEWPLPFCIWSKTADNAAQGVEFREIQEIQLCQIHEAEFCKN